MSEDSQPPLSAAIQSKSGSRFESLKTGIEPHHVKQREGWRDRQGNAHLVDYVEWHTGADVLDKHTPGWSHEVREMREIGEIFVVTVAITIDGITREGLGTGAAGTELGIKKAEHDALKRAAVKFGVGRELYKKESDLIERRGAIQSGGSYFSSAAPDNPIARGPSDMVTAKQLGMIKMIGREKGVVPQIICGGIWSDLSLAVDELSKKSASFLIDHLRELPEADDAPKEVETGIPDAPANQNVREMSSRQTAPSTPVRENTAAQMRRQIVEKFNEVDHNADQSLAAFDAEQDMARKRDKFNGILNFIGQIKREEVRQALDNSGWDSNGIAGELGKFGIADLSRASAEQVERIWADFRSHKQL